jgi:hypothetical protein
MNMSYKELLPADFAADSRVWIYQCNRLFTIPEALQAEDLLNQFVNGWQSHGTTVKGYTTIFFGQFIIIMADENATGVSGCSTDSSVRVIKEIEKLFGVTMFDRTSLAFVVKDKVQLLPLSQLQYALDNKFIVAETIYFNNLVTTKQELETKWLQPVKESWLAKRIALTAQ